MKLPDIPNRPHDFRTSHFLFFFLDKGLVVVGPKMCAEAPWTKVDIALIGDDIAVLRIGDACIELDAQDDLFLKPIIDSYQRSANDAANPNPETPERTRLGTTPPADVA
jgi:hypothetical protein